MQNMITFFLFGKTLKNITRRNSLFLYFLFIISFFYIPFICSADALDSRPDSIIVKYEKNQKLEVIKIDPPTKVDLLIEEWLKKPGIESVEPNFKFYASLIPSDTYYGNQWYLKKIKATESWNIKRESPEIVVAVVDTGIQINHPDLRDNVWKNSEEIENKIDDDKNGYIDDLNGWDFINNNPDPSPKFTTGFTADGIIHGTAVAGILGASGNNAAGVAGITWKVKIMALKALDDRGEGSTDNIIKAIDYAINNGADIINFSFVGRGYSRNLEEAIRRAYNQGILIVAAAGNEQKDGQGISLDKEPLYPVCHDGRKGENMVIGVSALDSLDQKADFTGYGHKCIDIASPGVSMFSTSVYFPSLSNEQFSFNKYYDGYWSGTSMSVPVISGAFSLITSANPSLSRNQTIKIVLETADNLDRLNPDFVRQLGAGRINVINSLVSAQTLLLGQNKVITAPLSGTSSIVSVFDSNNKKEFDFFAYHPDFKGGVKLTTGDVNSDGNDEIITGPGAGGGPHVRIFNYQGKLLSQFFAYDAKFRGGVNVASGDVNGDGKDEIITGPGAGGGPHVRIFNYQGNILNQFFSFENKFREGVNVAIGNVIGGTRSFSREIIVSRKKLGNSQIRVYSNNGVLKNSFEAYHKKFTGGVEIFSHDWNNDGIDDIITGPGAGGSPHLKMFDNKGSLINSMYALSEDFIGGISVAIAKIKNI